MAASTGVSAALGVRFGTSTEQKQKAKDAAHNDADARRQHGFTVFLFEFKPNLTRRDTTLGEAIRYLLRVRGSRMSFWRCPIRGLAVRIKRLPTTATPMIAAIPASQ